MNQPVTPMLLYFTVLPMAAICIECVPVSKRWLYRCVAPLHRIEPLRFSFFKCIFFSVNMYCKHTHKRCEWHHLYSDWHDIVIYVNHWANIWINYRIFFCLHIYFDYRNIYIFPSRFLLFSFAGAPLRLRLNKLLLKGWKMKWKKGQFVLSLC